MTRGQHQAVFISSVRIISPMATIPKVIVRKIMSYKRDIESYERHITQFSRPLEIISYLSEMTLGDDLSVIDDCISTRMMYIEHWSFQNDRDDPDVHCAFDKHIQMMEERMARRGIMCLDAYSMTPYCYHPGAPSIAP
jgi:hypothetical protein